jgi:ABC-type nitrate/sulfonate/bicarbonate transport system substrate-binding protein
VSRHGHGAPAELWYTHCPLPTASSLAYLLGGLEDEFREDGIAVRSLASSARPDVRESHYTHTQAASFRHGGNIPPLVARSRGADVRLLGFSYAPVAHPVLVRPSGPVTSIGDLRGRRVGVPRRADAAVDFWRATALRTIKLVLAAGGLTTDDVDLVDLEVGASFDRERHSRAGGVASSVWGAGLSMAMIGRTEALALVRGEVDAVASESQVAANARAHLGLDVLAVAEDTDAPGAQVSNPAPAVLTVSGALLDARPDLVARWLARVLRSAEWAREHERETKAIVAREAGVHEDFLSDAFPADVHRRLAVSIDDADLAALRVQHDFLLRQGFLAGPVDLEEFAAPEVLAEAHRHAAATQSASMGAT